jgi:hypothetical protein
LIEGTRDLIEGTRDLVEGTRKKKRSSVERMYIFEGEGCFTKSSRAHPCSYISTTSH